MSRYSPQWQQVRPDTSLGDALSSIGTSIVEGVQRKKNQQNLENDRAERLAEFASKMGLEKTRTRLEAASMGYDPFDVVPDDAPVSGGLGQAPAKAAPGGRDMPAPEEIAAPPVRSSPPPPAMRSVGDASLAPRTGIGPSMGGGLYGDTSGSGGGMYGGPSNPALMSPTPTDPPPATGPAAILPAVRQRFQQIGPSAKQRDLMFQKSLETPKSSWRELGDGTQQLFNEETGQPIGPPRSAFHPAETEVIKTDKGQLLVEKRTGKQISAFDPEHHDIDPNSAAGIAAANSKEGYKARTEAEYRAAPESAVNAAAAIGPAEEAYATLQKLRAKGYKPNQFNVAAGSTAIDPAHSKTGAIMKGAANLPGVTSQDDLAYARSLRQLVETETKVFPGARGTSTVEQRHNALAGDDAAIDAVMNGMRQKAARAATGGGGGGGGGGGANVGRLYQKYKLEQPAGTTPE